MIIVSDWEKVQPHDFYLSSKWEKQEDMKRIKEARRLQKEGQLYIAYVVDAKNYAVYRDMDSQQVFMNKDGDIVLNCETAIIGNSHEFRSEYPR